MLDRILTDEQRVEIRKTAKAYGLDRYSAALFAPAGAQDTLITLAAVFGDIARIPLAVSDPMLGEIRLQWWRDALATLAAGGQTGNPVADALLPVIARAPATRARLSEVIDQHSAVIAALAMGEAEALFHAMVGAESSAFATTAEALGVGADANYSGTIIAAGQAYGAVRFLLDLPQFAAMSADDGLMPDLLRASSETARAMARAALSFLRTESSQALKPLITALLPLALVEPYLRALEKPGHDAVRDIAEIAPLTRLWRLGVAAKLGRI